MEDFLTICEAAKMLNSHPNTVRNYIKSGKLPNTFRKGRIVLIDINDIKALSKKQA